MASPEENVRGLSGENGLPNSSIPHGDLDGSIPPSARLQMAHEEKSSHHVTVEDAPDESDNLRPSPVQKEKEKTSPSKRHLDLSSQEAFPSLGKASSGVRSQPVWVSPGSSARVAPAKNGTASAKTQTQAQAPSAKPSGGAVMEHFSLEPSQQVPRKAFGNNQASEVISKIMNRTGTTINSSTQRMSGVITFLIKGQPEQSRQARREIMRELAARVKDTIDVPASARAFIIGAKGRNLKGICERTSTTIQFPRKEQSEDQDSAEQTASADPDGEETFVRVTLEGDFEGVQLAKREIQQIVDERTSRVSVRLSQISPDYYALIAGPQQSRVALWESQYDVQVKIPTFFAATEGVATPPILLTGDKGHVQNVKSEIEALYSELQATHISAQIDIPKLKHRFIVGEKGGNGIQEILEKCNCNVILPPASLNVDRVKVIGPATRIADGFKLIVERANSMLLMNLDIAKAHSVANNRKAHARDLTRYLQKSHALQRLEKQYDVSISVPPHDSIANLADPCLIYEFAGSVPEAVAAARGEIVQLVNLHPPSRFCHVNIDPLHHRYIVGPKGKNLQRIREQHGVDVLINSQAEDDPEIVLVYGGIAGQPIPTADAMHLALEAIKAQFEKTATEQGKVSAKTLSIPSKHHKTISGPRGTTLNAILGSAEPHVVVRLGIARDGSGDADDVVIRGPSAEVDRVARDIQQLVEEAKHTEDLETYTTKFDFPSKFASQLIGKNGSNITKLSDELGVHVDIHEDTNTVSVQGVKKNAEEARSRIQALASRLEDEVTLTISIPSEFRSAVIGHKGSIVRRLEQKYLVRINFSKDDNDSDGTTVAKTVKEDGTIRGPRKGANAAKEELLELVRYEQDHSFVKTLEVPSRALAHIIGKEGQKINELKDRTGTRIDIKRDAEDGPAIITVQGTKNGVNETMKTISEVVNEIECLVTRVIAVDPKYHRKLIGPSGKILHEIIGRCGGSLDDMTPSKVVKFPSQNSADPNVTVTGREELVNAIADEMLKRTAEWKSQVTVGVPVPSQRVRFLIGRDGSVRRDLERKFNVTLDIPHRSKTVESDTVEVNVTGKQNDIDAVSQQVQKLVNRSPSQTLSVPLHLHYCLLDGGNLVRSIRSKYGIKVDHGNTKVQNERELLQDLRKKHVQDDDDELAAQNISWKIMDIDKNEEVVVPWNLHGREEDIASVKALIEQQLDIARGYDCIAILELPDSSRIRNIVGQGGSRISQIREKSGCSVQLPGKTGDGTVFIRGSGESVALAKSLVLEAYESANRRS